MSQPFCTFLSCRACSYTGFKRQDSRSHLKFVERKGRFMGRLVTDDSYGFRCLAQCLVYANGINIVPTMLTALFTGSLQYFYAVLGNAIFWALDSC